MLIGVLLVSDTMWFTVGSTLLLQIRSWIIPTAFSVTTYTLSKTSACLSQYYALCQLCYLLNQPSSTPNCSNLTTVVQVPSWWQLNIICVKVKCQLYFSSKNEEILSVEFNLIKNSSLIIFTLKKSWYTHRKALNLVNIFYYFTDKS